MTSPTARPSSALLDTVPAEHPLTAVVHAVCRCLDDSVITELTPGRLAHRAPRQGRRRPASLHDLTRRRRDLSAFVLFLLRHGHPGRTPGRANYAAANAALDALAQKAGGPAAMPATALAWGPWRQAEGMAVWPRRRRPGQDVPFRAAAHDRPPTRSPCSTWPLAGEEAVYVPPRS
ncbi:KR domain-containing protein [Streptosporangium vulgare]|uniref:KR domain-containing protein n=1 Tax=Streptosporangium vulgare TaxID=46190 RepID=UPI0031CDE3C8